MAAELVGGALLSAFLQVAFDRLTSPQIVDFFRGRKLDEKLLRNLKIMLRSIDALADDAELRQFTNPHIKAWLFDVKEAVFDAEDLLGEIDYELTRCQVEAQSQPQTFTSKVSNFFNSTFTSFNKKIESEMKEVLEKLEYLANQKGALGLKEGTSSGDGSGSKMPQKLPSSSLVVESVIYGRDADKDIIINWLTSETDNPNQPSILSIVGMGGLGKTTLAQHVYNDPKIEDAKFDIKAWVCVSDHFHVLTVTRTILEEITNQKDDSGNLQMVHKKLKEKLSGNKFFLVLDDVWNKKREEWEAVRTPLSYGAPGSKILVTTREEKVASNMSSKVHRLKQLRKEECWNVFENHALKDGDLELNDELKEIGRRIVDRCKGLPLALKTIGCLLRTKSSISDWKNILESEIWELPKENNEIIPALFMSYRYLPSHLKKCFAYCALFPKDYEFEKKELILMWMAQNFLQCPQQVRHREEVGEEYFNDLLSRSFFQQSGARRSFIMHDLLNDLAKYVCADFCFRLKFDKGQCIPETTRHFSFEFHDIKSFDGFGSLSDAKRLRSFLQFSQATTLQWNFKISIHDLFSKIKFIRMLSFRGCSFLKEVPDSVGDLKHLHSLDLSSCRAIKKLPDSICLLYNLLILKLNNCFKLKELPINLHKLTKLRCLEFEGTRVSKMPMHFGELKNLQVLNPFFVDRNSEVITKQLGRLGGLNFQGRLSINDVQNILNPLDALEANVKDKHLVKLQLKWKSDHIPDDPKKEKKVLQNLQPSKHLEDLLITNYNGTEFPSWVFDNSLSNLVSLQLVGCKYCLCLPPLGLLSSLKTLKIIGLDGIVSIGAEFYGSNSSFASLESLEFDDMKEWEEWECKTTSFPRLQQLYVNECPKLKGVHIKKVVVSDGGCDSGTIFRLDFFPKLRSLNMRKCQNLRRISQEYAHNHLTHLRIDGCPQFKSFLFPKPMQILFPSLTSLHITKCSEVELFPDGGLPLNILDMSLSCFKLIASLRETLDPNTCLESLYIEKLDVECFPDEVLLPRSLTSLYIRWCPNLKTMHFKGICHLSSLILVECPSLECLPAEGLPKSISYLTIWNCPLLKERCQNPDGEDWEKIAHIQDRHILS
uniref:CNL-B18 n=1 Tax=Phaseolus vulgaris TaxID=3885 RepID=B8R507_PHAVU|nr:NBS-LRR type putative disease resistance protein CNL-B18 [Phaseolus vulgaris]ACZ74714.1 CNL-B18 [Phaseolus vulgaris]